MVEPLFWRALGWCRLEVDLAGKQRSKGEGQAERRPLRTVLPVGSRALAEELLERIVPDRPPVQSPPPRRALWKSPLRYRMLAWGRSETCVATTSGRIRRVTVWAPLEKVQSLRRVQGPLQRRLRLATVHVDTAGRSVHAATAQLSPLPLSPVTVDVAGRVETPGDSRRNPTTIRGFAPVAFDSPVPGACSFHPRLAVSEYALRIRANEGVSDHGESIVGSRDSNVKASAGVVKNARVKGLCRRDDQVPLLHRWRPVGSGTGNQADDTIPCRRSITAAEQIAHDPGQSGTAGDRYAAFYFGDLPLR
jgi:hypothetical protein